jgi:hypothetical protein
MLNAPSSNGEKNDENNPIKNSNLKIFSFDQENLLQEIEAVKEIIQEENGEAGDEKGAKDNDSEKGGASDGSDSEPSLDNFEVEELIKLLPSLPKKKTRI